MNIIKDRSCNTIYHIPPPLGGCIHQTKQYSNTDKHACINTTQTQKSHIQVKCAEVRSVHVSFGFDVDSGAGGDDSSCDTVGVRVGVGGSTS